MKDLFKCTHLGSVSHGTLRNQDLIPAFLDAIQEIAPDQYAEVYARVPANLVRRRNYVT